MSFRPRVFDNDVLPVYKAKSAQTLSERNHEIAISAERAAVQKANDWLRRLLRQRSELPCSCRTEKRNELPSPHEQPPMADIRIVPHRLAPGRSCVQHSNISTERPTANPARAGFDERAAKDLSRVQRNADLTSRANSRIASRSAAWSARPAQFVSNCTPDSPMSRCRSFNFPTTVSGEPMNTEPRNVSSSVISVRRCEVFQRGWSGGLFCRREESASRRLWFWKCRISVGP